MTQTSTGKYCGACDRHIKDYTGLSQVELNNALSADTTYSCGRFRPDQLGLNRTVLNISNFKSVGLSVLGLLGLGLPDQAIAQSSENTVNEIKQPLSKLKFPLTIQGTISETFDSRKFPVPCANVQILQNNKVVKTNQADRKGYFSIDINEGELNESSFDMFVSSYFCGYDYKPDTLFKIPLDSALKDKVFALELTLTSDKQGDPWTGHVSYTQSEIDAQRRKPKPAPPLIPTAEPSNKNPGKAKRKK
jgi:hypothetical protein